MIGDFAPRLAKVLTEYCRPVHEGAYAVISAPIAAQPLIEELYKAIMARGGYPSVRVSLPDLREYALRHGTDAQFDFNPPDLKTLLEEMDMYFVIFAATNPKALSGIDPARLQRAQEGARPLNELYLGRCEDGSLAWNISPWPTQSAAQQAEMGFLEYEEFVYRACGLHYDDPVAHWQALRARQDKLVEWLAGKERVEVRGPGIDLSFSMAGRGWVNCWGQKNFPDGEIFTAPVEDSVNGHVAFSYPTVYGGREVNGVQLTFKDGCVVEASATKGEDFLHAQLDMDEGAKRLGEFAIGTNYGITRFTGETLFDEKIGGTIHMALGSSAGRDQGSGGQNDSVVHWDIVHAMRDGGEIWVDGELLHQNGQFVVEV